MAEWAKRNAAKVLEAQASAIKNRPEVFTFVIDVNQCFVR
jgi:hypothetical protein